MYFGQHDSGSGRDDFGRLDRLPFRLFRFLNRFLVSKEKKCNIAKSIWWFS